MPGLLDAARGGCAEIAARRQARRVSTSTPRKRSSPARSRCSTPNSTTSRARARTWSPTCSPSTRSTSARAGSPRCASARAAPATSRSPGRWPTASASTAPGPAPSCARLDAAEVAGVLGQDPGHELMALYARGAARPRAASSGTAALEPVPPAGSAERPGRAARRGHALLRRHAASTSAPRSAAIDLALAGVAEFDDLDRLTIFADNLVPHVLRVDGVLRLRRRPGRPHRRRTSCCPRARRRREIRACARPRLRADRRRPRRAAPDARRMALEPRPGAALQGAPAAPHAHRVLLTGH